MSIEIRLDDFTGTAFSNTSLPLAPPNLAAFTSVRFALFDGTLDNPIEAEGVLRTLQCTAGCGRAVPEPNAMLLIGVALGALGLARRRAVVRQRSGYIRRALALGTAHRLWARVRVVFLTFPKERRS